MAEPQKVAMQDGTTLEFSAKDKVKKMSYFTEDGSGLVVKFAFRDGKILEQAIDAGSPIILQAALHGLNQKFGDAFAGIDDIEDCQATFTKLGETIAAGDWTAQRVSDGMAGTSELTKALVKVTGQSVDFVKAQLAKLDKDQKAALRIQPEIVTAIAELKAAKPKQPGAVDGASVLAGFTAKPKLAEAA